MLRNPPNRFSARGRTWWFSTDRIQQVLTNLLTNALKYTEEGTVEVRGAVDGRFVRISVSDEGEGLQSRDIPHLFDKFYRTEETARLAKGVGLGLYICNAIITGHGGKMTAANRTDGKGACFRLRFRWTTPPARIIFRFRPATRLRPGLAACRRSGSRG